MLVVIAIVGAVVSFSYKAGANSATADFQAKKLELISKQDKVLKQAIANAKEQQRNEDQQVIEALRNEEKIVETIRVVEREIDNTDFVCSSLGNEFLRLFNAAIP